jgi:hypothetical protein
MTIHIKDDCTSAYKQAWLNHREKGNKPETFLAICETFAGQKLSNQEMKNIMASIHQESPRMKINKQGHFFGIRKIARDCGI